MWLCRLAGCTNSRQQKFWGVFAYFSPSRWTFAPSHLLLPSSHLFFGTVDIASFHIFGFKEKKKNKVFVLWGKWGPAASKAIKKVAAVTMQINNNMWTSSTPQASQHHLCSQDPGPLLSNSSTDFSSTFYSTFSTLPVCLRSPLRHSSPTFPFSSVQPPWQLSGLPLFIFEK